MTVVNNSYIPKIIHSFDLGPDHLESKILNILDKWLKLTTKHAYTSKAM